MHNSSVSKKENRKSLGATIYRAFSNKQAQQIKSSSAGSSSPAPELTSGKRRRVTQGSTDATLRSPPSSPYKQPKADTPNLTRKSPTRERKISRSASTPRGNKTISPSSTPPSARSQENRKGFATPGRIPNTRTTNTSSTNTSSTNPSTANTSAANTSAANGVLTRDDSSVGAAPCASARLGKLTSPQPAPITTPGLAGSGTSDACAAAQLWPDGLHLPGARKQVRPGSSPSRLQRERKGGKEDELSHAQWRIQKKKASTLYLAPYDAQTILKPYLVQVPEESKLKAELTGSDSNSSNVTPSRSDSSNRSRKLERRPSVQLTNSSRADEKEGPLPYPTLAREWLNETHYAKLPHAAKLMLLALSNLRGLHEQGKKAFGAEWAENAGSSIKLNCKQENEAAALEDREKFETLYEKAELAKYFDRQIKILTLVSTGPERAASIRKLAMQADHVLELALENLGLMTLRTDITPKRVCMYWEALTAARPKRNDIELLTAYFGDRCVMVQAFVNALTWLVKNAGHGNNPDTLKSIFTLGPRFLGYPYRKFQALQLYVTIDTMARGLRRAGMTAEKLRSRVVKMAENHAADVESANQAAQMISSQEASGRQELYREIAAQSESFIRLLLAGDSRFLEAADLDSITDPPSAQPTMAPAVPSSLSMSVAPRPLNLSTPTALHALPPRPQSTIPLPTLPPSPIDFGQ